jgi:hypothetical protein
MDSPGAGSVIRVAGGDERLIKETTAQAAQVLETDRPQLSMGGLGAGCIVEAPAWRFAANLCSELRDGSGPA